MGNNYRGSIDFYNLDQCYLIMTRFHTKFLVIKREEQFLEDARLLETFKCLQPMKTNDLIPKCHDKLIDLGCSMHSPMTFATTLYRSFPTS